MNFERTLLLEIFSTSWAELGAFSLLDEFDAAILGAAVLAVV